MVDCKALCYFLTVYSPSIVDRKVRFAAIQDIALALYPIHMKVCHYLVVSLVGFPTYRHIFHRDYPNIRAQGCRGNQENFPFECFQFRGMVIELVWQERRHSSLKRHNGIRGMTVIECLMKCIMILINLEHSQSRDNCLRIQNLF